MKKNDEIIVYQTTDELFEAMAKNFTDRANTAVAKKGHFFVALSGGNTPKLFFDTLSSLDYCLQKTPWKQIHFFFGDERYVPSDDVESNYYTANSYLFTKVPIERQHIYRVRTEIAVPEEAALDYEKTIRRVFNVNQVLPSFDLVYLGLGDNAHTASLMPSTDLVNYYANDPSSRHNPKVVDALFVPALNMYRITFTPPAINHSNAIIFMVTGQNKAGAVWNVLEGPSNPIQFPAQLIHCLHAKTLWSLDKEAAEKLTHTDIHHGQN